MEKNIYENPRMEHKQVKARCGMLAGSGYTADKGIDNISIKSSSGASATAMFYNEGNDYGYNSDGLSSETGFSTKWE